MENTNFDILYNPDYLPEIPVSNTSGDYTENGLRMCGICHSPKQTYITFPGGKPVLRTVLCRCQREAEEQRVLEQRRAAFETRMRNLNTGNRLSDLEFLHDCFDTAEDFEDDLQSRQVCQRYAENWPLMRQNNIGMLIYGSVKLVIGAFSAKT